MALLRAKREMRFNLETIEIQLPAPPTEIDAQSLYTMLESVTEQSVQRGRRYEAALVLTLLLLAKLAGEQTMRGIAQSVNRWRLSSKADWPLACNPSGDRHRVLPHLVEHARCDYHVHSC